MKTVEDQEVKIQLTFRQWELTLRWMKHITGCQYNVIDSKSRCSCGMDAVYWPIRSQLNAFEVRYHVDQHEAPQKKGKPSVT